MPKEVLDLRSFSGGLNNNTNPRDLDATEFQELKGLSLETPGKLKVSGAVNDLPHVSSADEEKFTTTLNHGNGLFHFNSDRDPNDAALSNTELLLINDVTNHKVKVFDKNPNRSQNSLDEVVNDSDFIFLSVPTPANLDGSVNLDIVDEALSSVNDIIINCNWCRLKVIYS